MKKLCSLHTPNFHHLLFSINILYITKLFFCVAHAFVLPSCCSHIKTNGKKKTDESPWALVQNVGEIVLYSKKSFV